MHGSRELYFVFCYGRGVGNIITRYLFRKKRSHHLCRCHCVACPNVVRRHDSKSATGRIVRAGITMSDFVDASSRVDAVVRANQTVTSMNWNASETRRIAPRFPVRMYFDFSVVFITMF